MFYAIYAFGPSWGYTVPGTPCIGTRNCIQTVDNQSVFIQISDQFEDLNNSTELKAIEAMIEVTELKGSLSLDELKAVADKTHPWQVLLDGPVNNAALQ